MNQEFLLREEGPRYVATLALPELVVEVVTGYEAASDRWPVHVYINGTRLHGPINRFRTKEEALLFGQSLAQDHFGF